MRFPRVLAIVLAAVLLIDQSAAFAHEQLHGTPTEAAAGQSTPLPHGSGNGKESCVHCGHFQTHFLGQITQAASDSLLSLGVSTMSVLVAVRIPIASLEPPYRPPRIPG